MKADEHIQTGMLVWDREGRTARVVSLLVACGTVREDGTVEFESKSTVHLCYGNIGGIVMETEVPLDIFLKEFHRRLTAWERLDRVKFYEPEYDGPLRGHFIIETSPYSSSGSYTVTRIERRARNLPIDVQHQREEAIATAGYCGHSERYENFSATSWKLVLDPVL